MVQESKEIFARCIETLDRKKKSAFYLPSPESPVLRGSGAGVSGLSGSDAFDGSYGIGSGVTPEFPGVSAPTGVSAPPVRSLRPQTSFEAK